MRKANIYLVSDSSGETVLHVANAVLAQFEGLYINKFMWSMVRSTVQIDNLMKVMDVLPGVILYTLVDESIEVYLKSACKAHDFPAISILGPVIENMGHYLSAERVHKKPGLQHKIFDREYEKRIAAIDFTLAHDDGQKAADAKEADIVLVGVSRTSKSPTALYLAQRGFKTANIPFINGAAIPVDFSKCDKALLIGLTINPEKLRSIRQTRFTSLGQEEHKSNSYTDIMAIKEEVVAARRFFAEHNITVIDVSNKAVEETAAEIITLYEAKLGNQ